MCGVLGYSPSEKVDIEAANLAFWRLLEESRIRGTHAYGIAQMLPAAGMSSLRSFNWEDIAQFFEPSLCAIAHCRYSTSGDWEKMENNQPINIGIREVTDGIARHVDSIALVFNGVIHMGTREEFNRAFDVDCQSENDGEIFLRTQMQHNQSPQKFLLEMAGSFAGTWLLGNTLYAGRNARRPLWHSAHLGAKWYASTRDIFLRAGFPPASLREVGVGVELA